MQIATLGESEGLSSKQKKANDKVKLGNVLMGTFVGLGAATAAAGATLAILSYVAGKERVEVTDTTAYVTPFEDGVAVGVHFNF